MNNQKLSLKDCLPCAADQLPAPLADVLSFSALLSASMDEGEGHVLTKHNEISFFLRRLWTYCLATSRPLALYIHTPSGGMVFGVKIDSDGDEALLCQNVPEGLPEMITQIIFMKILADTDSVACPELQAVLNPDHADTGNWN